MNLNLLLHAHYIENILRHFRLIETRLEMERPKDSWHILDHSTRGSEEDGELSTGTQHSLTRLSHTTQLENACHLLWSSQLLSESVRNHSEQKDMLFLLLQIEIFLTSAQVSSLPTERARVSEVPLNSKQRYSLLQTYTNQVFLTFAHLSTFRTGRWRVSS